MTSYDVEIHQVSKRLGSILAVDGLSLRVERGAFLTLLGPSGCGKTTTLRLIGGFTFPDEGEIYLRGEPMGRRPPCQRDTSMVFQNDALFPHMTVAGNIGFGLRERKVAKARIEQRVEEMLRLVDLPDFGTRRPSQLSGGQQQRVALARSLVVEPTVLLLDEPLGALDLKLRKQMQRELKHIQERVGITFIYVTHDQEEALTMSDRVVVMNRGKVEQEGPPEEIFERPRTRFVADFMGAENLLDGEVIDTDLTGARLRVAGAALTVPARGLRFGERVAVMIRPPGLRLLPTGSETSAGPTWPAVVTDRLYTGASLVYGLALPDGSRLVAEAPGGSTHHRFEPQDSVLVTFNPDDAVVIRDGARSPATAAIP
ncbi:MAG: ABC transporter ATP-binding protein [Chloroflexota bacterium]|nr:ABC transporter ATP-binding protein [Chloroflexota bacterium]